MLPEPTLPQTVVVVEDDQDIALVLVDYLQFHGYATRHLSNGLQALADIFRDPPSLVLLDLMLPGCDGLSILQEIRRNSNLPVILLTARVEEADRLRGLEYGADDYVCKPFSPSEVVARVRAVLRRAGANSPTVHTAPALQLNSEALRASLYGQPLNLTSTEFELLRALVTRPGRVFSRAQLLEMAYATALEANERAVDSHIKNLRRKFEAIDPDHKWIRTVYGIGFSLEEPAPR
jgi:two-component system, OmpR family, response regulator BaeR